MALAPVAAATQSPATQGPTALTLRLIIRRTRTGRSSTTTAPAATSIHIRARPAPVARITDAVCFGMYHAHLRLPGSGWLPQDVSSPAYRSVQRAASSGSRTRAASTVMAIITAAMAPRSISQLIPEMAQNPREHPPIAAMARGASATLIAEHVQGMVG